MNIEQTISELLVEYDCVVIPGFGGFIGNYNPAVILSTSHTFLPPSKSLLFNINLRQNDGLLATYLSRNEKITYPQALNEIEQLVTQWHSALNTGQTVEFKKLGQLIKDPEGNLQFTQTKEVNYLGESYGLTSFVSPAIRRDGFQRKLEKKITGYLDSSPKSTRIIPKGLKWAAILALPIGVATLFGVINFERIKTISTDYAGILIPEISKTTAKQPIVINPVKKKSTSKLNVHPALQVKTETQQASVKLQVVQTKPGDFAIIIGAFKFKENAENLVIDLKAKGYDAAIVGQTRTGLYRVSLNSFNDKEKAIQQLALVRSGQYPGAWLLLN
jgi:hypothetical protein